MRLPPFLSKAIDIAAILMIGAWMGFLGWQIKFAPFVYSAESGRIATELMVSRTILEAIDRGDTQCARALIVGNITSALDVSVPASLNERIDQRFHDRLALEAAKARGYLSAHSSSDAKAPCYTGPQSDKTVDRNARMERAPQSP